jgi:predicted  nucleic acid-binding Zn-ribbon protein
MEDIKLKSPNKPLAIENFSKYDFVKSYVATTNNNQKRQEKEKEAVIIADAIKINQDYLLANLATKDELITTENNLKSEIREVKDDLSGVKEGLNNVKNDLELVKDDLKELRAEVNGEFKDVRGEMKNLEIRLLKDIKISMLTTIISLSSIMALIAKFVN